MGFWLGYLIGRQQGEAHAQGGGRQNTGGCALLFAFLTLLPAIGGLVGWEWAASNQPSWVEGFALTALGYLLLTAWFYRLFWRDAGHETSGLAAWGCLYLPLFVLVVPALGIAIWFATVYPSPPVATIVTVLVGLWTLRMVWILARSRTWTFAWILVALGFYLALDGLADYIPAPGFGCRTCPEPGGREVSLLLIGMGALAVWLGAALVRRKSRQRLMTKT
jgi:hypothetical protein